MNPRKIWPFIRKNILIISAIISMVGGAVYLIDRFKLDSKISNLVVTLVNGIINLKIPDSILAILIILIFIFLLLINKKFMGFSPNKIKEIELNENQLFILALIAESDEASIDSLFMFYKILFPEERRLDIKNIVNILQKNGLINWSGYNTYVATDKGIERASKESEIRKKYRERIEEFREMDKIAKKY